MAKITLFTPGLARYVLRKLDEFEQRIGGARAPDQRRSQVNIEEGITFQNTGSTKITAYGLMRVDSSVGFGGIPIPTCKAPDGTYGKTWLVNGPDDVVAGDIGTAQRGPIVTFAYDSGTPTSGDFYGAKPSQCQASKNYSDLLEVIDVLLASQKLARGFLHRVTTLVGKADSNIAAIASDVPGSGTVSIYYLDPADGKLKDSGMDVTGRNLAPQAVTAGAYIRLVQVDGFWMVTWEACSA